MSWPEPLPFTGESFNTPSYLVLSGRPVRCRLYDNLCFRGGGMYFSRRRLRSGHVSRPLIYTLTGTLYATISRWVLASYGSSRVRLLVIIRQSF